MVSVKNGRSLSGTGYQQRKGLLDRWYKDRQRAWMKNHGQWQGLVLARHVSVAAVRILFPECKTKHDRPVYWRCSKGGKCESVSIREDDLKRVAAEAMGLEDFDEDRFRGKWNLSKPESRLLDCPFQEWENRRDFLYAYAIQAASQGTEKGERRKVAKTVRAIGTISRYTAAPINSRKKRRVAGYARVSPDHDDQISSYEAQVDYYTNYIRERDDWCRHLHR